MKIRRGNLCQGSEILSVGRFCQGGDGGLELPGIHPAIAEADFFQASDFKTLDYEF